MRVLLVCSFKEGLAENAAPFVVEQKNALQRNGIECDIFLVRGKGVFGYLKQFQPLKKKFFEFQPDIIHAHYGLCGLLANMQRKVPVVTTYHGSDINDRKAFVFSRWAIRLSAWNIFVSRKTMDIAHPGKNCSLIPCGIDLSDLQLTLKSEARNQMRLDQNKHYVLFAGAFDNKVKNITLALDTIKLLDIANVELMELKGYSRDEVSLLMCSVDALLMTSLAEGSPQVIKEAMVCGCPIVSVDVGDVKERMDGVGGCFMAETRDPKELAGLLKKALLFSDRTQGREKIVADGLDNRQVARTLVGLYEKLIGKSER